MRGATLFVMSSSSASDPNDPKLEFRCPECGTKFEVSEKQAERDNKAKCPKGHEVPLAKMI
jgi:putative FmdB family regulatory protein